MNKHKNNKERKSRDHCKTSTRASSIMYTNIVLSCVVFFNIKLLILLRLAAIVWLGWYEWAWLVFKDENAIVPAESTSGAVRTSIKSVTKIQSANDHVVRLTSFYEQSEYTTTIQCIGKTNKWNWETWISVVECVFENHSVWINFAWQLSLTARQWQQHRVF